MGLPLTVVGAPLTCIAMGSPSCLRDPVRLYTGGRLTVGGGVATGWLGGGGWAAGCFLTMIGFLKRRGCTWGKPGWWMA